MLKIEVVQIINGNSMEEKNVLVTSPRDDWANTRLNYLSPKSSLRFFVVPPLRRAAFLFRPDVDFFLSRMYSVRFVLDAMSASQVKGPMSVKVPS